MLAAIDRYSAAGLDGVEVFYTSHTEEQTLLLADRCAELGLLRTGSSDYHGPDHKLFSRFRAFDLHGREPNLGPIAHGTLAAPAPRRRRALHLAHRPVGVGQVHRGPHRRRRAARPRPPRGDARRRRRSPEHLRRARASRARTARSTCAASPSWPTCSPATAWSRSSRRCRPTGARATTPARGWASASSRSTCARRWRRARSAT